MSSVLLDYVTTTDEACTGVAPITVGDNGSNSIIIIPGANLCLTKADIDLAASLFSTAKVTSGLNCEARTRLFWFICRLYCASWKSQ